MLVGVTKRRLPLGLCVILPLSQGAGKLREQSQEVSLAKFSTKSCLWSARSQVQALKKTLHLLRIYPIVKIDLCVMCLFLLVDTQVRGNMAACN